jgi:hypothetical protein
VFWLWSKTLSAPAIVARPAIVPRSSDRGIFIQPSEILRFLFWHSACDVSSMMAMA